MKGNIEGGLMMMIIIVSALLVYHKKKGIQIDEKMEKIKMMMRGSIPDRPNSTKAQ